VPIGFKEVVVNMMLSEMDLASPLKVFFLLKIGVVLLK